MHIDLPDKRYYSIGEVAKAFDVNTSLIRFWEKEFDVLKPRKNAKGNRMFTPDDIKNLQLIYHLVKERGYTLDGAKDYLKKAKKKPLNTTEVDRKSTRLNSSHVRISYAVFCLKKKIKEKQQTETLQMIT